MGRGLTVAHLCSAVLYNICEKTVLLLCNTKVRGKTLIYTTRVCMCCVIHAPEPKALHFLTVTYLLQTVSQIHCCLHRIYFQLHIPEKVKIDRYTFKRKIF